MYHIKIVYIVSYDYYLFCCILTAAFNCGHFSQMVWKDTKQLGIGLAKGKNGAFYVVANYSPRGNIINRFTSNILPPKNKK